VEIGARLIQIVGEDLGWMQANSGGLLPISWAEIRAVDLQLGLGLEVWESRAIHKMSEAYIAGVSYGGKPMVLAPCYEWQEDDPGLELERKRMSEGIKAGMKAMMAKGK
jgi:hypothetical protein